MIKIHFTLTPKNHAQAMTLLLTLKMAGANLDSITVETDKGDYSVEKAIAAWQKHLEK